MRLGFMQPYFFPYVEYFRLIASCDLFVLFDTSQFSRGTWMSRNRILNRNKCWQYFGVPISSEGRRTIIRSAKIDNSQDWTRKIYDKIRVYSGVAPHYALVRNLLEDIFSNEFVTLADLNVLSLRHLCAAMEIDVEIVVVSELALDLPTECQPGEWALLVCKAMGATEYRNPSGGSHLYDPSVYRRAGVELSFHEHIDLVYDTGPFEFVSNLSIIDTLMWVDEEEIRKVLKL